MDMPSRSSLGSLSPARRALLLSSLVLAAAAVLCSGMLFAGSRSSNPFLFGRYSLALSALIAVHAVLFMWLSAGLLFARKRILDGALAVFSWLAGSGALAELKLFGVPPVLLMFFSFGERFTPLAGERLLAASAVMIYAALIAGILAAGGPARAKLAAFRGILALVALVLVFFTAEIALRILYPGSIFHPLLDLRPNVRVVLENKNLPGVSSTGIYSTNKWGMRGEQPPEDWDNWLTMVCIGGSTTQCFELDDSRTWPWLLQENLRQADSLVWVGNGGLGGHGTRGHLVFMREVIPVIHPDIVVFLIGANELSSFAGYNPGERQSLGTSPLTLEYRVFCASRVAQILYMLKKAWIDDIPVQGTPWARPCAPVPMTRPETDLPADLHTLMFDPEFTRNNVRQLIGMARDYGVTPVFLTQPMLLDDTPYWRGIQGICWGRNPEIPFSAATTWRMIDTASRDVMEVCMEEGALCYDLARAIPHSPEFFYDEGHFSEAGAALVADSVAAFMLRSGLVPSLCR
jgi:lysophospholipase L1-like esterase